MLAPKKRRVKPFRTSPRSRVVAAWLVVGRLALLVPPLLSDGCNAILGIDDPPASSAPPADAAADGGASRPDVRIEIDSGLPVPPEGGSSGADAVGAADVRDGEETGADGSDSGSIREDGGAIAGDAGDAGNRIILLRGTISTLKLAPNVPGNVRLVDHGIAVPWKSCNASNCVSGGIAP
jgi:hypothetical protein